MFSKCIYSVRHASVLKNDNNSQPRNTIACISYVLQFTGDPIIMHAGARACVRACVLVVDFRFLCARAHAQTQRQHIINLLYAPQHNCSSHPVTDRLRDSNHSLTHDDTTRDSTHAHTTINLAREPPARRTHPRRLRAHRRSHHNWVTEI